MGVTPQLLLDDWDRVQREDYAHKAHYTVAKLPCCGSSIEVDAAAGDTYVECPNPSCPKRAELGRPCRHLVTFGLRDRITTERPPLQL